jgi:hypothetical protein
MTKPTTYSRTAKFTGLVSFFANKLDPRLWQRNAPDIWTASYLIDSPSPGAAQSVTQGPATSLASSELDPDRAAIPSPDVTPGRTAWNQPASAATLNPAPASDGLFFEEVMFAGFTYRNVLRTSYLDDSKHPTDPIIRFEYAQYDCLQTIDAGQPMDGGLDVDNGAVQCVADPEKKGHVKITISKTVRFTQPEDCVEEVNALASVLVPLTFDSWLHDLIFL